MTLRTIHPIGNKPYNAPNPAVAKAIDAGMPNTAIATSSELARPTSAAICAGHRSIPRVPSKTTTGKAAHNVERVAFPIGSYVCDHISETSFRAGDRV